MYVEPKYPPNFARILAAFPKADQPGVFFCYGRAVYNPSKVEVPDFIMAHEEVHSISQGDDPEGWWDRYIADRAFRLNEELLAHRCEYVFLVNKEERTGPINRPRRRQLSKFCAERLLNPLYDCHLTKDAALRLIRNGAKNAA